MRKSIDANLTHARASGARARARRPAARAGAPVHDHELQDGEDAGPAGFACES